MKWLVLAILLAQTRIASDFEIAQMQQQIARSHDFLSQLSGHLNLGDLYLARSETVTARAEYEKALEIAAGERIAARKASDMTRYATATAYTALADAKLGRDAAAFSAAEESIRYTSDSAKSWNLYATAMSLLRKPAKAASAARNAVAIATRDVAANPSVANRLDLAVYEYSLASAFIESGRADEAERLLRTITTELRSNGFASLRHELARGESFQIYSTARGDEAAYPSLVNRAGLRLASLLEQRGDAAAAKSEYERVLEWRTDDPTALAALARLSSPAERERYFAAAFDANPFSMTLIREYQRNGTPASAAIDDSSTGGRVRKTLIEMHRGEMRAARHTLDALLLKFPNNDTLKTLRRETEEPAAVPAFLTAGHTNVAPSEIDLRQLLALLQSDKLTAEQRAALDRIQFVSVVIFDPAAGAAAAAQQTVFASGAIGGVRFKFAEPTAFTGSFGAQARLTYRILGATEIDGADAILLEPVRLER
jgi:hypothetical protein